MKNNILTSLFLLAFLLLAVKYSFGQKSKSTFIRASPNVYAPNFYSDKLNLQVMLVNLPGVQTKGSSFAGSYSIYFVPEGEIERIVESRGGTIDELKQTDVTNKILLNQGSFSKPSPALNRTLEKSGILFRQKVPDKQRTMLGEILIFYSLKIYDAVLKKSIYKESVFFYLPFEPENMTEARKTLYLSFYINENGKLYTSSLPRDKSSTSW